MNERITTPTPQEEDQARPDTQLRLTRRGKLAAGALLAASIGAGLIGINNLSNEAQAGTVYEGEINPDITSVQVYDGANVRSNPNIGSQEISNRLDTIDIGDGRYVTVQTPDGAYVVNDRNGSWYGIRAEDIATVLDVDHLDNDKDGIVWINHQRADIPSN